MFSFCSSACFSPEPEELMDDDRDEQHLDEHERDVADEVQEDVVNVPEQQVVNVVDQGRERHQPDAQADLPAEPPVSSPPFLPFVSAARGHA